MKILKKAQESNQTMKEYVECLLAKDKVSKKDKWSFSIKVIVAKLKGNGRQLNSQLVKH
jgi:hypothetical protein